MKHWIIVPAAAAMFGSAVALAGPAAAQKVANDGGMLPERSAAQSPGGAAASQGSQARGNIQGQAQARGNVQAQARAGQIEERGRMGTRAGRGAASVERTTVGSAATSDNNRRFIDRGARARSLSPARSHRRLHESRIRRNDTVSESDNRILATTRFENGPVVGGAFNDRGPAAYSLYRSTTYASPSAYRTSGDYAQYDQGPFGSVGFAPNAYVTPGVGYGSYAAGNPIGYAAPVAAPVATAPIATTPACTCAAYRGVIWR